MLKVEYLAHELGKNMAEVVGYMVCGGLSGVMNAASENMDLVFPTGEAGC